MVGDYSLSHSPTTFKKSRLQMLLDFKWLDFRSPLRIFVQYSDHVKSELLDHQTHVHDLNTGPVPLFFFCFVFLFFG